MNNGLQEFRCSECNKLLGKIEGRAEIVCTRCKVFNAFGVPSEIAKAMDAPEFNDQFVEFCKANKISAASIIAVAHSMRKGETRDVQIVRGNK